uniref:Ig-like domain-containing protein n=1 Tax=Chrysemys picta bellii TaxID=8478 RepID=A0A8C3F4X5_CHRPI
MGRVLPPQHDAGERELPPQGPLWRAGGPATLRVLLLALLWRGSLSLESGYSLMVPQSVSVQEGLCVLVPCNFTYPASYDTNNPSAQLYRYWYKDPVNVHNDPPVASNDPSRNVSQDTQGRFRLTGDPAPGDCSLQISDARRTDAGRYFLRVEKGDFKYSYRTNNDHTYPVLEISLANGTWAHSSELSFTPAPGDDGKELVCKITYHPPRGPSTSRTVRLHGDSLRFLCSVSSNPPAALGWVRGGRAIEDTRPMEENQLRLELPNMTAEDGGLYGCWARRQKSSAQGTFQLLVEYSAKPPPRPQCHSYCSCSLRSHPPPRLQWQVDGEPLAGNSSQGALQVSAWAQGDEAISTLSWTGSGDGGPRIFCLGSNPHGNYTALHFDFSLPRRGQTFGLLGSLPSPGRRVGSGCWKQGSWETGLLDTIHRPGRGVGSSGKSRGPGARTPGFSPSHAPCCVFLSGAEAPLGPGEPDELHYAAIDFSKLQRKGAEPPEAPATEYSEVQRK